ncbi:MAG TPA: hypothetical protein VFV93_01545 [Thermomicrobiales bacterium]|nr:hypothetical protein [Thermomicrobiales bacterium]
MSDEQQSAPGEQPEDIAQLETAADEAPRTSRDVLYEQIGLRLMNAGVVSPAATFITDVRAAAGFRVSPREVVVAVEQIAGANEPITVEAVAGLVETMRGGRSARQQRHADAWRTLGAQLALRGMDGTPEGQRAFIGIAHAVAGRNATDALLLQIALTLAEQGQKLDAETVGKVGKRLAASAADIQPEQLPGLVEREVRGLLRDARSPKTKKSRPQVRTGPMSQAHNPGARKWRPGGRRRRKIQFPPKPKPEPFER